MGLLILLFITAGAIIFIISLYNDSDLDIVIATTGTTIFACGIAMIPVYLYNRDCVPTALDVYRGNTTLQITYQDSIPVDSVVVFKNK